MNIEEKPNSNPTPATQEASAPILSESFDSIQRMRTCDCPQCGVLFAYPLALFIHKLEENQQAFCPNGHAFIPKKASEIEANADRVILLTELLDAKNHIAELEQTIAEKTLPPGWSRNPEGFVPAPGDMEELKRRSRILLSCASAGQKHGTRQCVLCGRDVQRSYFVLHQIRRHADKVAAMPAGDFE